MPIGDQEIDSGTDPNDVGTRTAAFLSSHPDTQAILTLGPTSASPVIKWVRDQGASDKYFFATFDLSEDIVAGIKDGVVDVAVDQQPFIQGYGGVEVIANYLRYGVLQANDIASGPGLSPRTTWIRSWLSRVSTAEPTRRDRRRGPDGIRPPNPKVSRESAPRLRERDRPRGDLGGAHNPNQPALKSKCKFSSPSAGGLKGNA